jgi:hypothetical protein
MKPSDLDSSLSRTLASWRVTPQASPNFRPAVWERIREKTRNTWGSYMRSHLVGWSLGATVAMAVAAWTGHSVAQSRLEQSRDRMVVSYLVELDPRVMAKLPH